MDTQILQGVFYVISASFGLLAFLLMLFSARSNIHVNKYIILILSIGVLRTLISGTYLLKIQTAFLDLPPMYKGSLAFCIVFFYLYVKSLAEDTQQFKWKNGIHLLVPLGLFVYYYFLGKNNLQHHKVLLLLNLLVTIAYMLFYWFMSLSLIRQKITKNLRGLNESHFRLLRNWTIFLFIIFSLGILRYATLHAQFYWQGYIKPRPHIIPFTVALMSAVHLKILISPEILLGIPKLRKRIVSSPKIFESATPVSKPAKKNGHSEFWHFDEREITGLLDIRLKEILDNSVESLVDDVEKLVTDRHFFRNHHMTIKEVSLELGIPYTHLIYVFKYHCKYTFTEYKTRKRIDDAQKLISLGYLKHNTLESLATEVGYASYNPFFRSFKTIVGMSPNDFATRGSG